MLGTVGSPLDPYSYQYELVVVADRAELLHLALAEHGLEAVQARVLEQKVPRLARVVFEPVLHLLVVEVHEHRYAVAAVEVLALPVHLPGDERILRALAHAVVALDQRALAP